MCDSAKNKKRVSPKTKPFYDSFYCPLDVDCDLLFFVDFEINWVVVSFIFHSDIAFNDDIIVAINILQLHSNQQTRWGRLAEFID